MVAAAAVMELVCVAAVWRYSTIRFGRAVTAAAVVLSCHTISRYMVNSVSFPLVVVVMSAKHVMWGSE